MAAFRDLASVVGEHIGQFHAEIQANTAAAHETAGKFLDAVRDNEYLRDALGAEAATIQGQLENHIQALQTLRTTAQTTLAEQQNRWRTISDGSNPNVGGMIANADGHAKACNSAIEALYARPRETAPAPEISAQMFTAATQRATDDVKARGDSLDALKQQQAQAQSELQALNSIAAAERAADHGNQVEAKTAQLATLTENIAAGERGLATAKESQAKLAQLLATTATRKKTKDGKPTQENETIAAQTAGLQALLEANNQHAVSELTWLNNTIKEGVESSAPKVLTDYDLGTFNATLGPRAHTKDVSISKESPTLDKFLEMKKGTIFKTGVYYSAESGIRSITLTSPIANAPFGLGKALNWITAKIKGEDPDFNSALTVTNVAFHDTPPWNGIYLDDNFSKREVAFILHSAELKSQQTGIPMPVFLRGVQLNAPENKALMQPYAKYRPEFNNRMAETRAGLTDDLREQMMKEKVAARLDQQTQKHKNASKPKPAAGPAPAAPRPTAAAAEARPEERPQARL